MERWDGECFEYNIVWDGPEIGNRNDFNLNYTEPRTYTFNLYSTA